MKVKPNDMATLERLFKDLSAMDAVEVLCQVFNAINAVVYIDNKRFALHELYDDYYTMYCCAATDIDLRFYGGPPGSGRWFSGTLLTLLMDHAAYCLSKGLTRKITEAIKYIQRNGQLA